MAYGAWSAGNLIYDHREAIGDFIVNTAQWNVDAASAAWGATTGAVSDATQWAGNQLSDASGWAGDRLGDAAELGSRLLPDVKMPDLNPF